VATFDIDSVAARSTNARPSSQNSFHLAKLPWCSCWRARETWRGHRADQFWLV